MWKSSKWVVWKQLDTDNNISDKVMQGEPKASTKIFIVHGQVFGQAESFLVFQSRHIKVKSIWNPILFTSLNDFFLSHCRDLVHQPYWKKSWAARMLCLTISLRGRDFHLYRTLKLHSSRKNFETLCAREAAYRMLSSLEDIFWEHRTDQRRGENQRKCGRKPLHPRIGWRW